MKHQNSASQAEGREFDPPFPLEIKVPVQAGTFFSSLPNNRKFILKPPIIICEAKDFSGRNMLPITTALP